MNGNILVRTSMNTGAIKITTRDNLDQLVLTRSRMSDFERQNEIPFPRAPQAGGRFPRQCNNPLDPIPIDISPVKQNA